MTVICHSNDVAHISTSKDIPYAVPIVMSGAAKNRSYSICGCIVFLRRVTVENVLTICGLTLVYGAEVLGVATGNLVPRRIAMEYKEL